MLFIWNFRGFQQKTTLQAFLNKRELIFCHNTGSKLQARYGNAGVEYKTFMLCRCIGTR